MKVLMKPSIWEKQNVGPDNGGKSLAVLWQDLELEEAEQGVTSDVLHAGVLV